MMFRSITIGVTTPYNNCVDFLDQFIDNFWTFNQDSSITSSAFTEPQDVDYQFSYDIENVKNILKQKEQEGLDIVVLISYENYTDSLHLTMKRLYDISHSRWYSHKNSYELDFSIGYGEYRIEKANQYTDYGRYLSLLLPKLKEIGCFPFEITCKDIVA